MGLSLKGVNIFLVRNMSINKKLVLFVLLLRLAAPVALTANAEMRIIMPIVSLVGGSGITATVMWFYWGHLVEFVSTTRDRLERKIWESGNKIDSVKGMIEGKKKSVELERQNLENETRITISHIDRERREVLDEIEVAEKEDMECVRRNRGILDTTTEKCREPSEGQKH
ncbi:MAG: hypothetical protein LBB24_03775 [Rickettsiales bacterium]|jgi:hypothetical protein|nr:hypothetical protein [Rickettsiales bacterium]